MNTPVTGSRSVSVRVEQSAAGFGAMVAATVVASWVPVLVGATTRAAFGWTVAALAALALAWFTRRRGTIVLIAGLVISSALVPSGLVTDATHYMPVAVTGGALALRFGLEAANAGVGPRPPLPVLITVALYLVWAALATVTAISHRTSAIYLVGMVAVCALAFWVVPNALSDRRDRGLLLIAVGATGVVVALSVYIVSVAGGFSFFGRLVGFYQVVDLTVGGSPTGIRFGYSSGAFLTPLEPSVLMVMAIVALLGWSSSRTGRELAAAMVSVAFIVPAVLLTLDRSAQLAATVAAGVFAILALMARQRVAPAALVCAFFAAVFLLVFANYLGANSIGHGCTSNCAAVNDGETIRGGTGLSGREYLWQASWDAIKHRPILGYGPGNDVPAIDPYLSRLSIPSIYSLAGLTSHSTWFRTAVEMGIPGLLLLIASGLAIGWVFVRRALGAKALPDATQIALAAAVCGLLPAMTFETFLLGGVTFSSLFLTVAAGLSIGPTSPIRRLQPSAC